MGIEQIKGVVILHSLFSIISCWFLSPNYVFQFEFEFASVTNKQTKLNLNCFNILDLRNLQEQVKKALCSKNCTDLSHTYCPNKLF